jgi:NAD(P)-dependent dehydrogenase (short-subunit alcohol dehydrogenase family)
VTTQRASPGARERTVVITGAAGGIGRSLALAFAREGDHVVAVDRNEPGVNATAELVRAEGGAGSSLVADVASRTAVEEACDAILERRGRVDVLCNNAAVRDHRVDAALLDPEIWDQVMAVNVTGTFLFSHFLLPGMLEHQEGVILNISSICGIGGGRAGVAYTTSKHAIIGLTKNVAFAFAERGIRCNAICPGSTDTESSAAARDVPHPDANPRLAMATSLRPGGRIPPDHLSSVAVFLASDLAQAINGHAVVADRGWMAA